MRVPSQRSHAQVLYNSTAGREERSGLRCTSSHPARIHRSAPRMRSRIGPTRASSPTSEMPKKSVAGILTEKSLVTWPTYLVRTGSYRPRIRADVFFKKLFGSPAGFGFAWRAAEFECEESAYPNTPDPRRYYIASATSSTTFASRSVQYTCAHSCLRCNSLFAPAQAGRVALMLLPAHVLHAFCNLLIGR